MSVRRIYKYEVPIDDHDHSFDLSGEIVHVAQQDKANRVVFWAVSGQHVPTSRIFRVVGTGHLLPEKFSGAIGTVQDGPFVWHLIEVSSA